jgi:hypothetical protein
MPSTTLIKIFSAASALGCLMSVARFSLSGLSRRYPAFTCFFAFLVVDSSFPVLLSQDSDLYFYVWIVAEPVLRVFCVFGVLELYRLMLERYKGLYSLGRWVMYGASIVSVAVSVLMLLPRITPALPQRSVYLGYVYAFNRGVDFSLTVFILLILLFLSQYPVVLSRNLVVHASLYSIYFLCSGTYSFVHRVVWNHSAPVLDTAFAGIVAACTIAWFFLLTPKGEEVKASRIRFSPEYEARVLEKLDALNQVLLKSARR